MNEVSIFYKQKFCSRVEGKYFDNIFWTEANPAYALEDERGSSMEISSLLPKSPVIAEKYDTARSNMVRLLLKHMAFELI